jgi:hypothetical protein
LSPFIELMGKNQDAQSKDIQHSLESIGEKSTESSQTGENDNSNFLIGGLNESRLNKFKRLEIEPKSEEQSLDSISPLNKLSSK